MARTFRLVVASVMLQGLFGAGDSYADALEESWRPDRGVTRYNREWRLSAPRRMRDGRAWFGHLGFVREDDVATLEWDSEAMDFRRGLASGGVIVPFVVDLDRQLVAFQLVPGQVKPRSFTGALQTQLNAGSLYFWTVEPLQVRQSWADWLGTVESVTRFHFRLERPNPDYHDDDLVERLVDGIGTEATVVEGRSGGVNVQGRDFRQLVDHAIEREYGEATIEGVDREGDESEWRTSRGDEGGYVPVEKRVSSPDNQEETSDEQLLDALDDGDFGPAGAVEPADEA